jgi:hypothetical protein
VTPYDRVHLASQASVVAAVAGAVALVMIGLFFAFGQPWGTVNDVALLVMTLAIAPLMLGSYELGGRTPLWPARISLAAGIGAVLVWSVIQLAMIVGLVTFGYETGATGAFAIASVAQIVIGLWLIGAPLLAGPWLPPFVRSLGALSGLGFVLVAIGLLRGGVNDPLTYAGGLGYQVLFPFWALLLWPVFSARLSPAPAH